MIEASACAKFILFGEHVAVYGYPVIAFPLSSLRAKAVLTKAESGSGLQIVASDLDQIWSLHEISEHTSIPLLFLAQRLLDLAHAEVVPDIRVVISSAIPVASGLGSGAAVSVAFGRALLQYLGLEITPLEFNGLIYEVERFYHGNPSGIDNSVIVYEKPLYFVRGREVRSLVGDLDCTFLVIDSGVSASTMVAVSGVRSRYLSSLGLGLGLVAENLVSLALTAIEVSDYALLIRLMLSKHCLLQSLGVSHEVLDRIVFCVLEAGYCGVKLSGGGCGGNLVAVCFPEQVESLRLGALFAGSSSVYCA